MACADRVCTNVTAHGVDPNEAHLSSCCHPVYSLGLGVGERKGEEPGTLQTFGSSRCLG